MAGKKSAIKVGAIGYGGAFNMGWHHFTEMQKAGMVPTAVVDVDASRLAQARKDFPGIETYTSTTEMLKKSDVELVVLITPHNTHAKLALECLRAGRHVVCEKPMAITTAECDQMIAEAKKKKVMLSVYHNRHWDGCILNAVKHIKDKGAIGEVVRIHAHMTGYNQPGDWWRSSRTISGGILYDWGVHLLEYSLQLMADEITEVSGFSHSGVWAPKTAWKDDTNEDEGYAVVRFKKGGYLTLCLSQIDARPSPHWLEITGTKGAYAFDGGRWEMALPKKNETVVHKGQNPPGQSLEYYQNVADHLMKGKQLVITSEWARRPIHIIDLAVQSAKKGQALKAKYK